MLKIPRVTNNAKVNFIEQAFQPSTPKAFSTPPYMVLNVKFISKNTNMEAPC